MPDDSQALLLQVSADVSRLTKNWQKAVDTVDGGSTKMERRAELLGARIATSVGHINPGAALTKIFDSSRLAVLEEGSAKLRVFGSALEPLGPLGIAAAGGVVALGFAVEKAFKISEWAEALEHAAKTLGLTTTELQEFDFVALSTGIPVDKLRESLGGLERTIGLVKTGAARASSIKAFTDLLKIQPSDLVGWGDLETQLPHILDAAAKLDAEARQGLAAKLKIDPEVLNSLIAARGRITDLITEAHKYGFVIDQDVIEKSAEAGREIHTTAAIMDAELKPAFAGILTPIAHAADALVRFIAKMREVIDNAPGLAKAVNLSASTGGILGLYFKAAGVGQKKGFTHVTAADIARYLGDLPSPTGQLSGPKAAKGRGGGPTDQTDSLTKTAAEDLDRAEKALAEAYKSLTGDIQAAADFQIAANAADAKAQQDKLNADLRALLKNKGIEGADSDAAQAKIEKAKADVAAAQLAKDALVQRTADFAIEDRQIEVHRAIVDAQLAQLQAEADMAVTAGQRAAIEKQILILRQQLERDLQGTQFDREAKIAGSTPEANAQATKKKIALDDTQQAELRAQIYGSVFPGVHDAITAAIHGGWPGLAAYMAQKLEENLVNVLANLATNFVAQASAGGGGNGLGQLLQTGLSFFGFAGGGNPPVGTPYWVGEHGPELRIDRTPGTIIPNSALGNMGSVSPGMSVQQTIVTNAFDLRGALVVQDVLDQMNDIAQGVSASHLASTGPSFIHASYVYTKSRLGRSSYNRLV